MPAVLPECAATAVPTIRRSEVRASACRRSVRIRPWHAEQQVLFRANWHNGSVRACPFAHPLTLVRRTGTQAAAAVGRGRAPAQRGLQGMSIGPEVDLCFPQALQRGLQCSGASGSSRVLPGTCWW